MQRVLFVALALALIVVLPACGDDDDGAEPTATEPSAVEAEPVTLGHTDWYRPPVGATWQWQLSGDLDASHDAQIYDIDLFDVSAERIADLHADRRRVICYFSAGSSEDWRADFDDFDESVMGEPLEGWEGERWLDITSGQVLDVMLARLDLAQRKGCDGVEPDNVQSYDNDTGFDLTEADQIAYNLALAEAAHDRGLAIGLKNAAELIPELIDDFDFSVNEECHDYDECAPYEAFIAAGKPVFNAEYADRYVDDVDARAELCAASAAAGFSTLVLDIELDGRLRIAC